MRAIGDALQPTADHRQQLGRGFQVPVGRGWADMTQIGGQQGQLAADVGVVGLIPAEQGPDGETVT